MSSSTPTFTPGARVAHPSYGIGRVTAAVDHETVRVRFDDGLEPILRAADLVVLPPEGFAEHRSDDGSISDFEAPVVERDGFTVTQVWTEERGVQVRVEQRREWLDPDEARDLAQTILAILGEQGR
ncbi:hypothetical protein [Sinomonas soli]